MREAELKEYLSSAILNYASEKVKSGNWSREEATQRSKESFDSLLPDGVNTKNQFLFTIREKAEERTVGMIWVGVGEHGDQASSPWIWDFLINDEERGKGYGREALGALEDVLRGMGERRVSLQVFGHNEVAIGLYKKSGYRITNLVMTKDIANEE